MKLVGLSPERWRQVQTVASLLLDGPPGEREQVLTRECQGDLELRNAVLHLVSHYSEDGDLFGCAPLLRTQSEIEGLSPGDRIGAYRIERELGRGGMGRVCLASRADDAFHKNVAIKVIRFSSAGLIDHFRGERRILAGLEHENIARLHDAGTTPGGSLYFVMEYVAGQPLDVYCQQLRLDLEGRLELFRTVCLAVEYAHRNGIVHRDLKPSNILVNTEGVPKLLDFGIAASAAEGGSPAPGMTLAYASPEQALGRATGPAGDVYSLGVILYELLTAGKPYELTARDPSQAMMVATQTPVKPARHVTSLGGDLDSIVMRALSNDPMERYQSAGGIALDLDRRGRHLPVLARRGGLGYRSGKFVRRNSWAVAAAAISLFAVLAFVSVRLRKEASSHAAMVTRLTTLKGRQVFPSISPDGKQVVFASRASGNWNIHMQGEQGSPRNLTAGSPADDTEPAFSPDGKQIAFRSERDGGGIFLMDTSGMNVRKLSGVGFQPAWSPDGKEIAVSTATFTRLAQVGFPRQSQLLAIEVKTGRERQLTPDIRDAVQPAWSPDGRRIAFWGVDGSGNTYVCTVNSTGEPQTPTIVVRFNTASVWNPFWSPSGKYLYYDSDHGGTMGLWRVPIRQTTGEVAGESEHVALPVSEAGFFSLSRDGRRLAYTQDSESWNVERVKFDPRTITAVGEPVAVTQGQSKFIGPTPSPDGTLVTFQSLAPQQDIYVCSSSGGNLKRLTSDGNSRFPRWIDAGRIGFITTRGGQDVVMSIHKDGSGEETWTQPAYEKIAMVHWMKADRILVSLPGRLHYVLETGKRAVPFEDPSPDGMTFGIADFNLARTRILGSLDPLHRRDDNRLAIYDLGAKKMKELGVSGASPAFLDGGRLVKYQVSNRVMLLDRSSGRSREIFRLDVDELLGSSLTSDMEWMFVGRSRTAADIWVARMEPPL